MATARQIEANRRNARKSTGPRSAAGKQRSSKNALQHGLSVPRIDPEYFEELEELARRFAGGRTDCIAAEFARSAAVAKLELVRVRQLKISYIENIAKLAARDAPVEETKPSRVRRKAAVGEADQELHRDDRVGALEAEMSTHTAHAIGRGLAELLKLARYEARAAGKLHHAVRSLIKNDGQHPA